jgi:pyruvate ferredoxin oxidoreductase gamma subunit
MFRIRLHGRGGQGIKTAGMILGRAFFLEGYEVQDAPRYGAERRGAPLCAYVRAARTPIIERGMITRPDLVVVADETLVPVSAAGVLQGAGSHTTLLIHTAESASVWRKRLPLSGRLLTLPAGATPDGPLLGGVAVAGAAARLVGVIGRPALAEAVCQEVAGHGEAALAKSVGRAVDAFDAMAQEAGVVTESGPIAAENYQAPDWIDLPFEGARVSAPAIHAGVTSVLVHTGVWRTLRPVIDYSHCRRCSWICSTFCPDSAIQVEPEHTPRIDYEHCKGCMVCLAVCPSHAIRAEPEGKAAQDSLA